MTSTAVFAQNEAGDKGVNTIVQKIAQKFNLSEADVQAVFDEEHKTRMAEMNKVFESNLSKKVSDGTLTEDQKQKIIAKKKELEEARISNFEKFKDMTPNERKAAMEKQKSELESWAKENGIDLSKTMFFMKFKGHRGGMGIQ